jgi:DsbC/DsbD-like thiol-disulfide interchange protein
MKSIIAFLALIAAPAYAQTQGHLTAQVVQGGRSVAGNPLAAIDLSLATGWKTYWRVPGEGGGIPAEFDWTGSKNLAQAQVLWPAPIVWGDAGMSNIGYKDKVTLPVELTPIDPALPIVLQGQMDLGICKDICIPVTVALTATVTGGFADHPRITPAMARLAVPAADIGATNWACSAARIKDGMQITAAFNFPETLPEGAQETVVFEHSDGAIWASGAQVQRNGARLTAVADLVPPSAAPFDLKGDDLRITILAGGLVGEILGCPLN